MCEPFGIDFNYDGKIDFNEIMLTNEILEKSVSEEVTYNPDYDLRPIEEIVESELERDFADDFCL